MQSSAKAGISTIPSLRWLRVGQCGNHRVRRRHLREVGQRARNVQYVREAGLGKEIGDRAVVTTKRVSERMDCGKVGRECRQYCCASDLVT